MGSGTTRGMRCRGGWWSRRWDGSWLGALWWWLEVRNACTSPVCLSDVGMYVPSKIFQASQQSVKLLSSPHQHEQEGKVSPFPSQLGRRHRQAFWLEPEDPSGESWALCGRGCSRVLTRSTGLSSPRATRSMQR